MNRKKKLFLRKLPQNRPQLIYHPRYTSFKIFGISQLFRENLANYEFRKFRFSECHSRRSFGTAETHTSGDDLLKRALSELEQINK